MPEIAEVRLMCDFINTKSKNKQYFSIVKSTINKNHKINHPDYFNLKAETRGKELQLILNNNIKITFTMGMSAEWVYSKSINIRPLKHSHLFFFDTNGGWLYLTDIRRFAKWKIRDWNLDRGPDPISDHQKFKDNIVENIKIKKLFHKPIYEILLNQKYFNGIGNYLRSTILYYLDINPFQSLYNLYQTDILKFIEFIELCKTIPEKAYQLGGGQLKDWTNPLHVDPTEFRKWVYYKKGNQLKDKQKRTFWYNPKWNKSIV